MWGISRGPARNLGIDGPWAQIDRFVYRRVFRYADGQHARIRLIFVDSGGHCTSEVYQVLQAKAATSLCDQRTRRGDHWQADHYRGEKP